MTSPASSYRRRIRPQQSPSTPLEASKPSFDNSATLTSISSYNAFEDPALANYWGRKSVQKQLVTLKDDFISTIKLSNAYTKRLPTTPSRSRRLTREIPRPRPRTIHSSSRRQKSMPISTTKQHSAKPQEKSEYSRAKYFPKQSPANSDSRFKPKVSPILLSELESKNVYRTLCYTPSHLHDSVETPTAFPPRFSSPIRRTVGHSQKFVENIVLPILNKTKLRCND
ncbi:hypothetical protein P9112_010834 [Eukaryota sp. TZLM1-RC]